MFFRSIQWRLIFILALITFILLTVVWVFLNYQVEQSYYDSFREEIAGRYESLEIDSSVTVDGLRARIARSETLGERRLIPVDEIEQMRTDLKLAEATLADKKRAGDDITLVIPGCIGGCYLKKCPVAELESVFAAGWED